MVTASKVATMSFCGGALSLDFLNTVSEWTPAMGRDYFENGTDFVLWTERMAFMEKQDFERFARRLKVESRKGDVLKPARSLRQTLFRIFHSIATGKPIAEDSLNAFGEWAVKAHARTQFIYSKSRIKTMLSDTKPDLLPLYHVVLDAERILLDGSLWPRIRMCPACGWFFLDTSKGGRRRWCDMAVCGSRDKALRYYHNTKH